MFWKTLYNTIAIPAMYLSFHIAARFHPKIREGIRGRKAVFETLENRLQSARPLERTAWFHFTSVGEFEQAKPLIEAIQEDTRIVLTYYSPSVHPNVAKYPHCDAAAYLPLDTRRNAERLIRLINPSILVFSKFDIWPNLVWCASKHRVPVILIAGTLHPKSKRLAPIARAFFRSVHRDITVHCVISESDAERFRRLCPADAQIVVTGDTRFDSVYRRAMAVDADEQFLPGQSTLSRPSWLAGSTYLEEERVLLEAYHLLRENAPQPPHLILVPHEPTPERVSEIQEQLDARGFSYLRFSELKDGVDLSHIDIIVIDTVGILAKLYRIADIAFVGGSFHGSVHNVMEPAAMAKPILFGPTIHNAYEASVLKDRGAARLVTDAQEMAEVVKTWLADAAGRLQMGQIAKQVIEENLGATERTLVHLTAYVQKNLSEEYR
jgi:3-deoxy-D-manno-octulosonic-acid transferase